MEPDRRQHDRLALRLPLECQVAGAPRPLRCVTENISTGGLCVEIDPPGDRPGLEPGCVLTFSLTVPPGAGHFPYPGHISGTAQVLRCRPIEATTSSGPCCAVAVRFAQPLQLRF